MLQGRRGCEVREYARPRSVRRAAGHRVACVQFVARVGAWRVRRPQPSLRRPASRWGDHRPAMAISEPVGSEVTGETWASLRRGPDRLPGPGCGGPSRDASAVADCAASAARVPVARVPAGATNDLRPGKPLPVSEHGPANGDRRRRAVSCADEWQVSIDAIAGRHARPMRGPADSSRSPLRPRLHRVHEDENADSNGRPGQCGQHEHHEGLRNHHTTPLYATLPACHGIDALTRPTRDTNRNALLSRSTRDHPTPDECLTHSGIATSPRGGFASARCG